ncbi:DNA topoisomerase IB [Solirubrobacter sp. CPCC 204708]|uniref:DNA topoisomerase n=1 Tax=Solirubrobacter deserti TaxID=2282478 RepID=A0ABT4RQZ4_9ACTN|nr:DNA topoisomerase IB [Solirubrobacter deserti]MBE2320068.1 DNA topoisomerase IB [Solirubrobacter deserti]MDA0140992.1 DNA topoisomerase IB [Solirubrobacter deserti]
MARLRRADCSGPGITRKRAGKGFAYYDEDGERITETEVVDRIRELGIPPAWDQVWICPYPNGHLQATGIDAAGRKQYRYHEAWRTRRDAEKFEDMTRFARALPALREHVEADLTATDELTRERVLACAVRLLDRGFFRIGTEEYTQTNESYGLATIRKEHVTIADGQMIFDYPAKSGQRRVQAVADPLAMEIVGKLKRRRGGGPDLLAFKAGGHWCDIKSDDINAYLKEVTGGDFSAKDFRTWSATVLAAVALAVSGPAQGTKTSRQRAKTRAIKETARYLGNTPAVCRASYIDPRIFDAYDAGLVLDHQVLLEAAEPGQLPTQHPEIENAVLDLLNEKEESPRLEKLAA